MPTYYIDTSLPTFYHDVREDNFTRERRNQTRKWWDDSGKSNLFFSSVAVIDEIRRGHFPGRASALTLLEDVKMLEITDEVPEIVHAYHLGGLVPSGHYGCALHLAIATYHRCDYFVTWYGKDINGGKKRWRFLGVNHRLGYFRRPVLVSPAEMMESELRRSQFPDMFDY